MESQIILILFGGFLLLMFIGAPITVALGVSTLIFFVPWRKPDQICANCVYVCGVIPAYGAARIHSCRCADGGRGAISKAY